MNHALLLPTDAGVDAHGLRRAALPGGREGCADARDGNGVVLGRLVKGDVLQHRLGQVVGHQVGDGSFLVQTGQVEFQAAPFTDHPVAVGDDLHEPRFLIVSGAMGTVGVVVKGPGLIVVIPILPLVLFQIFDVLGVHRAFHPLGHLIQFNLGVVVVQRLEFQLPLLLRVSDHQLGALVLGILGVLGQLDVDAAVLIIVRAIGAAAGSETAQQAQRQHHRNDLLHSGFSPFWGWLISAHRVSSTAMR